MTSQSASFSNIIMDSNKYFTVSGILVSGQQSWLSGRAQNSQAVDQNSRLKQH